MGEVRFMISEAAKQVHVESHVLRYWEEELGLKIGRTEMGHRYYTEDDIQLFCCIKKLKNEGMLLRDLKPLIPVLTEARQKADAKKAAAGSTQNTYSTPAPGTESPAEDAPEQAPERIAEQTAERTADQTAERFAERTTAQAADPTGKAGSEATPANVSDKPTNAAANSPGNVPAVAEAEVIPVTQLEQVRGLIGDVLTEVVASNNQTLEKNISKKVTNDVLREMDYLFQANERREEEHYRKLDMLIRQQQEARRESVKDSPAARLKKILT